MRRGRASRPKVYQFAGSSPWPSSAAGQLWQGYHVRKLQGNLKSRSNPTDQQRMLPFWGTVLALVGIILLPPIYFLLALFIIDRRLNRHIQEIRASLNVTAPPNSSQLNASNSENPGAMGTVAHAVL